MNDTMKLEVHGEVDVFVAEVERRLADLTAEERDELVGGLRADLSERLADHDGPESAEQVLGDPASYAVELRTAAGFTPVMAVRGERRPALAIIADRLDGSRRTWVELLDRVPGSPREVVESLQPVWWVLRAWVAWMLAQDATGASWPVSYSIPWLAVLLVLVVGSVQLGRGTGRLARVRAHTASRLALIALNVLAVCLLPGAVDRAKWGVHDELESGYACCKDEQLGLFYNDVELTNLFPYDAEGKPLTGVQLFTADGTPLAVSEGVFEEDYLSTVYPWLSDGTPRYNAFPLPVGEVDAETGERRPDAWTDGRPPRLPAFPFRVAPRVELPDGGPAVKDSADTPSR